MVKGLFLPLRGKNTNLKTDAPDGIEPGNNKMRKKLIILLFCPISCFLFIGCAPTGFVKAVDGGTWSSIMIREDLTYDQAFNEVIDVVARRFEMDMISKDGGYVRTNRIYTWNTRGV